MLLADYLKNQQKGNENNAPQMKSVENVQLQVPDAMGDPKNPQLAVPDAGAAPGGSQLAVPNVGADSESAVLAVPNIDAASGKQDFSAANDPSENKSANANAAVPGGPTFGVSNGASGNQPENAAVPGGPTFGVSNGASGNQPSNANPDTFTEISENKDPSLAIDIPGIAPVSFPYKNRCDTWVSGCTRWIKKYNGNINKIKNTIETLNNRIQKNHKSQISKLIAATEAVYPELKTHINYVFKIRNGTYWTAQRYTKSGFIEKRYIEECPFCRNIAPETIEHMLLECSRWQALRADILAQYISIYRAQLATKPPLLPASISIRLVGKLLGEELKLSITRIRKDPSVLCVKTTLATANSVKIKKKMQVKIQNRSEILPTGYGVSSES
ncbi:hypothetical protein BB561_004673 [Smittium simulii]|uniref:Uncharacterized protein n=1 Tax=Smittium simulii TaxID=133385 RepID=A0A2T9YEU8_9FUNG|nr:hypothetical protein BB561_004673 [Smittium simulii]